MNNQDKTSDNGLKESKAPICCIGHITHDRVITPEFTAEMPGGTSYYFAGALAGIAPEAFRVVTAVGKDEESAVAQLRKEGLDVKVLPSKQSVFFENRYGEDIDSRTQRVLAKAAPFTCESLKNEEAQYFHLGTLLADDFEAGVIRQLAARGRVSLDVQGYLRRVEGEDVKHQDFERKREILPYVEILKANEVEMEVLTGSADPYEAARILADWGVKEVVLTLGSKGSLIYSAGEFYEIPAYRPEDVVDATGCGDTYMAGYLYRRSKGDSIPEAGRYAAAMCSLKLARKGPLHADDAAIRSLIH
ncbi:MAG: ribokinase [Muribaculaceae bacterium]|nr:ribokinase [Muribaculaceae bacterium]